MTTVTDQQLIARYVTAAMEQYFARKLPTVGATDLRRRIAECLKGLTVMRLSPGDILFSEEIDAVWHYWILETAEYAALCDKLGGEFIHHSSHDYPATAQTQGGLDAVRRLIVFFAIYVSRFGPLEAERLVYWPALATLLEVSGWSLDFTNRLLLHRAREFDSALEAWRPIHALDQSS